MDIRGVDPRDTTWELDHARYRVYFWDRANAVSDEYEISGEVDVEEVLAWAAQFAEEHRYTVYVSVKTSGDSGLIRLTGVLGDPFARPLSAARDEQAAESAAIRIGPFTPG
ncbi:hypothetical protein GCM10010387_62080 [Streptomyces inusitatus]|uniref:Uncharacterized protein n=1 Tax=Streptomyces inusitatus TaxID=68221 RepID=A0A918V2B4_9ACTN|nr:hypothetical protein [Streptomyces inusitatus]GGZ59895.1 hypothetical protein GCM10010387_62080 [Streptomyces inusitatus]